MLCFGRKVGESFEIRIPPCNGGLIKIMVVGPSGPRVRVGVDAPLEYQVLRDNAKSKERKSADGNYEGGAGFAALSGVAAVEVCSQGQVDSGAYPISQREVAEDGDGADLDYADDPA